MGSLAKAEGLLAEGENDKALMALIEVWRMSRSRRVAELVEVLSTEIEKDSPRTALPRGRTKKAQAKYLGVAAVGDPRDVPSLIAALTSATSTLGVERLRSLSDDPRVTTALLRLLEQPPFTAQTTKPFWREVLATLQRLEDPRVIDVLERLSEGYVERIATSVGEWLGNQVKRTAKAIRKEQPRPPVESEVDVLERLEARFERRLGAWRRTDRREEKCRASESELLEAVYATPDDEGARQVYLDWLLERDDPRGELMALQVAKLEVELTREQCEREKQLIAKLRNRLLGSLAAAVSTAKFERGFATGVALWGTKTAVPKTKGKPEWATVQEIHCNTWPRLSYAPDRRITKALHDIIVSKEMRSLRGLSGLRADDLARYLNTTPLRLESLWIRLIPDPKDALFLCESLGTLPELRRLGLELYSYESNTSTLPDPILDGPWMDRLEHLAVVARSPLGSWLSRLEDHALRTFSYRPAQNINLRLVFGCEDGRLSEVRVQHYQYSAGNQTYPTELLCELLSTVPNGHLTRCALTPCDASAGHFHDAPGADSVPRAAGAADLREALARFGVTLEVG